MLIYVGCKMYAVRMHNYARYQVHLNSSYLWYIFLITNADVHRTSNIVHQTSYLLIYISCAIFFLRFHHLLFFTTSLVLVLHLVCASTTAINTMLNIERIELPNCKT